jgi:hypothetical protein
MRACVFVAREKKDWLLILDQNQRARLIHVNATRNEKAGTCSSAALPRGWDEAISEDARHGPHLVISFPIIPFNSEHSNVQGRIGFSTTAAPGSFFYSLLFSHKRREIRPDNFWLAPVN